MNYERKTFKFKGLRMMAKNFVRQPLFTFEVESLMFDVDGQNLKTIACMRYCRGRPERSTPSDAGDNSPDGQMTAAGGPLRAEGFPKRRCQFEFVAAERRI